MAFSDKASGHGDGPTGPPGSGREGGFCMTYNHAKHVSIFYTPSQSQPLKTSVRNLVVASVRIMGLPSVRNLIRGHDV